MDIYKKMLRAMICKAIDEVMNENGFIVKAITELSCRDDSIGNNTCLHFEYEAFVWDMMDESRQITLSGCGYVSETGVHAVEGAWSTEEGWC